MRRLVYFMHSSLDGFVARSNGEMDWITVDDEIFDFVTTLTDQADTALYGRVTYQMMEAYWPTAGELPNASRHELEHSIWYKNVSKVVLSKTMSEAGLKNTKVIRDNLSENINKLKQSRNGGSKNILIFGSPRASHSLLNLGLVDEFWIFISPILLGEGISLFKDVPELIKLRLLDTKTFASGVVALHYRKE